ILRGTYFKTALTVTTLAVFVTVGGGEATPLTMAAVVAQAWMLYIASERYSGWFSHGIGALLVIVALGHGKPGLEARALLVLGIGALGVGNSHRLSGEVREARADQAILEERARIARELHDVVAHHVSTIAVQADTARLTTPGLPAAGEEKLE